MKALKRVFSVIVVLVIVTVGFYRLSILTERKASRVKYEAFYRQEEDFDVLFMGTSHVLNGIFPMELWKDYGIISYNFGGHANTLPTSYWQMVNAFDYTSPRLVVIDCFNLSAQALVSTNKEFAHQSLDAIPLSRNKIAAVKDLLGDEGEWQDFLFYFCVYHSRWKELGKGDFDISVSWEKGAQSRIGVAVPANFSIIGKEEKLTENTYGIDYLQKMIKYCQERDVEVLLTYLPFPAQEHSQKEANIVFDIAREYGINYLDYQTLKELVDFDIDCYDPDSHLNPSGARKVTAYIGQYITQHYNLSDQRENELYKDWHRAYEEYTQFKIDNIKAQAAINPYLMLLNDKNMSFSIYIKEGSALTDNEIIKKLLENNGIDTEKILREKGNLITVDRCNGSVLYSDTSEAQQTVFGELAVREGENGYCLYLDGNKEMKLDSLTEAGIVVFNNADCQAVAAGRFQRNGSDYNTVKD